MVENFNLDVLPKDADRLMDELADGHMVIARSKNDFLYVVEMGGEYHLFSHASGSPEGGRKQISKDEKGTAIIRNAVNLADTLFKAEFDRDLSLFGVMASAEEGILSMFPGDNRDEDGEIEFIIPNKEKEEL